MEKVRILEVKQSVFANNDAQAEKLREELKQKGIYLLNLMSSPGSGKTTTLLGRISFLIQEKHIPPSQLLVITYTKEAAASMQKRVLTENPEGASVTFGTFHAIFYHILKTEYSLQTDCLLSTQEKKSYLLPILKKYEIDIRLAEEMLYFITMRKNGEKTAEKLSLSVEEETKEAVFREYVAVTRKNGRIGFEDMLLLTRKLFREREDILKKWRGKWTGIFWCTNFRTPTASSTNCSGCWRPRAIIFLR